MVATSSLDDHRTICYINVWYQKISNYQLHGGMLEIPRRKGESQERLFKESVHPNRNFQRDQEGGFKAKKNIHGVMDTGIFKINTV